MVPMAQRIARRVRALLVCPDAARGACRKRARALLGDRQKVDPNFMLPPSIAVRKKCGAVL